MKYSCVVLFVLLAGLLPGGFAQQHAIYINSPTELRKALEGSVAPGTVLVLRSGQMDLQGEVVIGTSGTEDQPIVLRAEGIGNTELNGHSRIIVRSAAHVEIEGIDFAGTLGPAITIDASHHIRITRNHFRLPETAGTDWVQIVGASHHNRVDRNLFENKRRPGSFITFQGSHPNTPQMPHDNLMEYNNFRDIGPVVDGAVSAIRLGSLEYASLSGHTTVENNLFEHCAGTPEYVLVASSDNIIRYNTFRECAGLLSLVQGSRNRVEGNFFLGNRKNGAAPGGSGERHAVGTGGVRMWGDSAVILNNYFEGLTGQRGIGALIIPNGNAGRGEEIPSHPFNRVRNAAIAFNTLVNNTNNIEIGGSGDGVHDAVWDRPPEDLTIANNLIVSDGGILINILTPPKRTVWAKNIAYAKRGALVSREPIPGVAVFDPKLVREHGVWRLQVRSAARGKAEGAFDWVIEDIEGQSRMGQKDIGADEFSRNPVKRRPLTSVDVGPRSH